MNSRNVNSGSEGGGRNESPDSSGDSTPPFEVSFSLSEPVPSPRDTAADSAQGTGHAPPDLARTLHELTQADAPRWMASKGGLDHGPFTARQLISAIADGEVRRHHLLRNMDTGEYRHASEFAGFSDFIDQFEVKEREQQQNAAHERSVKSQERSNRLKIAFGVGALLITLGAAGLFVATRGEEERAFRLSGEVTELYERGKLNIEELDESGPSRGRTRRRRGRGRGGVAARTSEGTYEDAMQQAVELGDVSQNGGEQQLTTTQIGQVMSRRLAVFQSCVSSELRTNSALKTVRMDLAIAGSGSITGVSVKDGSPLFRRCVAAKARSIKFPSFSAPRMGTHYTFHVD